MANRFAVAAGNFNDTATWSTTATGSPGASVPVAGDNAIANTRTVTITANATCDNVTNGTAYGGTGGGQFVLSSGVTLTANVIQGIVSGQCVLFASASPATAAIVGTITGGGGTTTIAVVNNSSGTLTVTGNSNGRAFANNSSGTLTITGNCNATGGGGSTPLLTNSAGGVVNIIGNVVGGSGGASNGVNNTSNGAVNITGNVTGGSAAIGVNNTSTGLITIVGNVTATTQFAVTSTTATVRISGSFIHAIDGLIPISAARIILSTTPTLAKTRYSLNGAGTYFDMFTADNTGLGPTTNDVRSGVTYSGMTGTLAVPLPSQVAVGVPTDNTVGTAALTPAAVWEYATRTLTAGAGISASDVWSHASRTLTSASGPSATDIRQELDTNSTKLANLDATVSSRLASSAYSAAPTTAQIATAVEGSLLNEADGQAVLNALVGAIGNTNLSEVSLVAAVRADLERVGGKIDSIPTTSAPTAAANATAVWSAATKTITGGTVDTLTNSPSVPSAASIASATRSELAVELARVDAAVSTRLATSGYTAPSTAPTAAANASAVRSELTTELAKVAALNTDRLANVATTAIVGNLIAQANS